MNKFNKFFNYYIYIMINLSRINIGPNNTNSTELLIKSQYKIRSVQIDPFGSNKMRFHYPPNFNFILILDSHLDNYYNYSIQINKNEKNVDLANSKFFYSDGWTNNLTITCLLEEFKLDEICLKNFIPENYGTIEILNLNNQLKRFKVGIVIPTFGREDYLKECFESLSKSDLSDCLIMIVDESLTKDICEDKIKANQFIQSIDLKIPTIKIYKNSHGNMFDSICVGLDILAQVSDLVMTLDSDTIHKKNFINKITNTYKELTKIYKDKPIILSGFNTDKHKLTPIPNINSNSNQNYYLKETIGGCHLCFSSQDYWKYYRYTLISYKWDTNIYNLTNKIQGIIAVTKPSVIEHIGLISSVRNDDIPADKSIDFNLLDEQTNLLDYSTENLNKIKTKNFYVIGEEIKFENNQAWIIDVFKDEFIKNSKLIFVDKPEQADIIWIIGISLEKIRYLNTINLENKQIITTIHHICWDKIDDFNKNFNEVKNITTKFHVICDKVYQDLVKLTLKPITIANFWINENIFYNINEKNILREKYQIPSDSYCIGSFQRDTEGKDKCLKPKLSKGPDIFVKIAIDMNKKFPNLLVILTGRRRKYICQELENNLIKYKYFEMINSNELNELYNCLNLYVVSSRVEGGPRAIIECGIAKVPIISTNVGISNLILSEQSIYDMSNPITYLNAIPDVSYAYNKSIKYTMVNYLDKFICKVFN